MGVSFSPATSLDASLFACSADFSSLRKRKKLKRRKKGREGGREKAGERGKRKEKGGKAGEGRKRKGGEGKGRVEIIEEGKRERNESKRTRRKAEGKVRWFLGSLVCLGQKCNIFCQQHCKSSEFCCQNKDSIWHSSRIH